MRNASKIVDFVVFTTKNDLRFAARVVCPAARQKMPDFCRFGLTAAREYRIIEAIRTDGDVEVLKSEAKRS